MAEYDDIFLLLQIVLEFLVRYHGNTEERLTASTALENTREECLQLNTLLTNTGIAIRLKSPYKKCADAMDDKKFAQHINENISRGRLFRLKISLIVPMTNGPKYQYSISKLSITSPRKGGEDLSSKMGNSSFIEISYQTFISRLYLLKSFSTELK